VFHQAVDLDHAKVLALSALTEACCAVFQRQSSLTSLAAAFYPTPGRVTRVAWLMGSAVSAAVFGLFLVAELSCAQLGIADLQRGHPTRLGHRGRSR
jgi:hypothetical protein